MSAPFVQAFAELRAIVGPEKASDLERWRKRWIDEAAAPSSLSAKAAKVDVLKSSIRREQAASFGELLATRPGVVAWTERPLEFQAIELNAFLCTVRAEPKA